MIKVPDSPAVRKFQRVKSSFTLKNAYPDKIIANEIPVKYKNNHNICLVFSGILNIENSLCMFFLC